MILAFCLIFIFLPVSLFPYLARLFSTFPNKNGHCNAVLKDDKRWACCFCQSEESRKPNARQINQLKWHYEDWQIRCIDVQWIDLYLVVSHTAIRMMLGTQDLQPFTISLIFRIIKVTKHSRILYGRFKSRCKWCLRLHLKNFNQEKRKEISLIFFI